MDLSLEENQRLLKDAAADFLRTEYPPERARTVLDSPDGFSPEVWRAMGALGWLGLGIDEQWGGSGLGLLELGLLHEEFGQALCQSPLLQSTVLCGGMVQRSGTEAQKRAILPALASGRRIATLALVDAGEQWRPDAVMMQATRDGDGWRLNGAKLMVEFGHKADEIYCVARTDPRSQGAAGLTVFRVADRTDVTVERLPTTIPGLYAVASFQNRFIDPTEVIGEVHHGMEVLDPVLQRGAALQACELLGLGSASVSLATEYAKIRVQFGRAIGTYQGIQHQLADAFRHLQAGRLLAYQALWALESGKNARREVAMAKTFMNEAAYEAAFAGISVFGGAGYMIDHMMTYYTRRVVALRTLFGEASDHRETVLDEFLAEQQIRVGTR